MQKAITINRKAYTKPDRYLKVKEFMLSEKWGNLMGNTEFELEIQRFRIEKGSRKTDKNIG